MRIEANENKSAKGRSILNFPVMFNYTRTTEKSNREKAEESKIERLRDHRAHVMGYVVAVGLSKAGEYYLVVENNLIRDKETRKPQPRTYKLAGISNFRRGTVAEHLETLVETELGVEGDPRDTHEPVEVDSREWAHYTREDERKEAHADLSDIERTGKILEETREKFGATSGRVDRWIAEIVEVVADLTRSPSDVPTYPRTPEDWGIGGHPQRHDGAYELASALHDYIMEVIGSRNR
jgi:hypothetical protein